MSSEVVRVVCERGRWHEDPRTGRREQRVLAEFVRADDWRAADYWRDADGTGWRALRDEPEVNPSDREAPMLKRVKAYRDSMARPVTLDGVERYPQCPRCYWMAATAKSISPDWPVPEEPEGGHGPDCALWSAVCKCGWPTWHIPVRLMVPLLEKAAAGDGVVGVEEIEKVSAGYRGTTWLDDRNGSPARRAPSDREIAAHLRAQDEGRRSELAPGTRGQIPDGIVIMFDPDPRRSPTRRHAVRIATIERLAGAAGRDRWEPVEGLAPDGDGYRFPLAEEERGRPFTFTRARFEDVCDSLYKDGRRAVHLDDMRLMLMSPA